MMLPIIHHNGSGKDSLLEAAIDATNAVRVATEKLIACSPHGRDYYPYVEVAGQRPAIYVAMDEHQAMVAKLRAVHEELEALAIGIDEGGGKVDR